jgi:hypothetical protein
VTKLSKRSSARSRADALRQKTCRYLRNEGYDAFQKGDLKRIGMVDAAYERAIRTINIILEVSPSDRERLIEDMKRSYRAAKNGIKIGVMTAPINGANGALQQVSGQTAIVRSGPKPNPPAIPANSQPEKRNGTGGRILRKLT